MIGLAADHAGFALKEFVRNLLDQENIPYKDYGTYSEIRTDYADYGHALAYGIEKGEVTSGIAICGSGNGINMTLNKHQDIRAALCWNEEIARLARAHNNANVLVMPGRFVSEYEADKMVHAFMNTSFEEGRHRIRINKIPIC